MAPTRARSWSGHLPWAWVEGPPPSWPSSGVGHLAAHPGPGHQTLRGHQPGGLHEDTFPWARDGKPVARDKKQELTTGTRSPPRRRGRPCSRPPSLHHWTTSQDSQPSSPVKPGLPLSPYAGLWHCWPHLALPHLASTSFQGQLHVPCSKVPSSGPPSILPACMTERHSAQPQGTACPPPPMPQHPAGAVQLSSRVPEVAWRPAHSKSSAETG